VDLSGTQLKDASPSSPKAPILALRSVPLDMAKTIRHLRALAVASKAKTELEQRKRYSSGRSEIGSPAVDASDSTTTLRLCVRKQPKMILHELVGLNEDLLRWQFAPDLINVKRHQTLILNCSELQEHVSQG
jgi:hypothetical protein